MRLGAGRYPTRAAGAVVLQKSLAASKCFFVQAIAVLFFRTGHQLENAMTSSSTPSTSADQEFIEFAQEVFQLARTGDAQTLTRLLHKGLPPNMSNHKGDTLLMLAAYHGQVEATKALLEAGAEPDRYNDMAQTPLAGAAFKGYLPIVELLLSHGAQPGFAPPGGKTPLMFAAMFNRLDIVQLLLSRDIDKDARSSDGLSALDLARSMGAADTAACLEAAGKSTLT